MSFFDRVSGVSIRRAAGRAVLASAALTLLAACGNDLDRDGAAKLIAEASGREGIQPEAGLSFRLCVSEKGFLYPALHDSGGQLTPEGQQLFRSRNAHGLGPFELVQPITVAKQDVEVIGITAPMGQSGDQAKQIEFRAPYSFPGIPSNSPALECLDEVPKTITGSVLVQKYDDGWRITNWKIPGFRVGTDSGE